jgi:hypothetical protein
MPVSKKKPKPNLLNRREVTDQAVAACPVIGQLLKTSDGVPDSEWERVPADLSLNLDHYLYGLPRQ